MQKIDIEQQLISYGWYETLANEIPNLKAGTLYLELLEHGLPLTADIVSLNSTERGGFALRRLAKRNPIESRISYIIKSELAPDERTVINLRYLFRRKNGKPLSALSVSKQVGYLTPKQVELRLNKAKKKILERLS